MPLVGHTAVDRAIAGRGDDELRAAHVATRVRALLQMQPLVHVRERTHVGADLRRDDPNMGAGHQQRASLARGNGAAADDQCLDRVAVQHQWQLAHRNSPERGPMVRKAT